MLNASNQPLQQEHKGDEEILIKLNAVGLGRSGRVWDDGGKGEIIQIFISHGNDIGYIQFVYVENEKAVPSKRFGLSTASKWTRYLRALWCQKSASGWEIDEHLVDFTEPTLPWAFVLLESMSNRPPLSIVGLNQEHRGDEEAMIKMDAAGCLGLGEAWDDGSKGEIIQIFISHRSDMGRIGYIQFVYVEKEKAVPSKRFGLATGSSSRRFDTVDLNYPSEFLTWVSGSFGDSFCDFLTSITFGTNQGTYGPFGVKQKKEFCFQMGDRRTFAGFHGNHDSSRGIHSIGVYVKPPAIVNSGLKPGPTRQIKEENNQLKYIHSVCFVSPSLLTLEMSQFLVFEGYIYVAFMYVDRWSFSTSTPTLKSITFGINQGTYGPFGVKSKKEKEFCFRMGDRRTFGGFHGTYTSTGICSIGVYVKPPAIVNSGLESDPSLQIKEEDNQRNTSRYQDSCLVKKQLPSGGGFAQALGRGTPLGAEAIALRSAAVYATSTGWDSVIFSTDSQERRGGEEIMVKIDAAGFPSYGEAWDDGGKGEIIQILISHGIDIGYIHFMYVENENLVPSKRFGRAAGDITRFDTVNLNYPSEFLTWVSGSFNYSRYALSSITFGTNQGTYGPFGVKQTTEFCFRMGDRRTFAGFHGTYYSNSGIRSIGVYIKPPAIVNSGLKPVSGVVQKPNNLLPIGVRIFQHLEMQNASSQPIPIQKERGGDEEVMIKMAAAGYPNFGQAWDDGAKGEIIQIFISHGSDIGKIGYIQFMYVENEKVVPSKRFGGFTGNRLDTVDLNYPSEFVTWVSGSFSDSFYSYLTSVTFGTNQGTYGPFGVQQKKDFCFRLGHLLDFMEPKIPPGAFFLLVSMSSRPPSSIVALNQVRLRRLKKKIISIKSSFFQDVLRSCNSISIQRLV
ncbi:hypothetical protein HHK36_023070 [Tetracentron sinense]|uniref:Jacalin-type lectin domain-containing protein n=1 Tax=Tetracentron sinense TaxID=13715 RepID=A0A834YW13_TETSI|nr:hypothetical protein HHK36_023070 [Tetracentron sinense]